MTNNTNNTNNTNRKNYKIFRTSYYIPRHFFSEQNNPRTATLAFLIFHGEQKTEELCYRYSNMEESKAISKFLRAYGFNAMDELWNDDFELFVYSLLDEDNKLIIDSTSQAIARMF